MSFSVAAQGDVQAWGRSQTFSFIRRTLLRFVITAAGLLLLGGAVYTSVRVAAQQNLPSGASRYNVTWPVSQAGAELARLQATVGGAGLADGSTMPEDVQLRFDILSSRLQTLDAGAVRAFIDSDPEFQAIVADLRLTLDKGAKLVEKIDTEGVASELFNLLTPLNSKLARLASAANIRSGDHVAQIQESLDDLYKTFQLELLGVGIFGFSLIISLRHRNRALKVAYATADQMATELKVGSDRFAAALTNMVQGLCLFDVLGSVVIYNECFVRMFGAPPNGADFLWLENRHAKLGMFTPADPTGEFGDRRVFDLADERVIQVCRKGVPGDGWVSTFEDVTERRRSQAKLAHMARHDALTGLPNRISYRERMEHLLASAKRDAKVAVFCLDLDGFKGVNDTLGHPAGDELLQLVSLRLRGCVRDEDMVARLGGDEFTIIQSDANDLELLAAQASRINVALGTPFDLSGERVQIGVSIGIAVSDKAPVAPDDMLRNADIALYRAKKEGRGTWRLFQPEMELAIRLRQTLEQDLRRAIDENEFHLRYQPLVDASTLKLNGFEALVRWQHPQRGLVSPIDFISLAEETGLIRKLGLWVLRQACRDATTWPKHLRVAVNLSPVQFLRGDLVTEVKDALHDSGLSPNRLELEITESVMLHENDSTLRILRQLQALDIRIAMDDFGTGYSSLSFLRQFPFSKIKIDQSFIREIEHDRGSIEIVRAIVGLGKALGMEVLAEGVETSEQLDILQVEGCDQLQGYLFSKPQTHKEVQHLIASLHQGILAMSQPETLSLS